MSNDTESTADQVRRALGAITIYGRPM